MLIDLSFPKFEEEKEQQRPHRSQTQHSKWETFQMVEKSMLKKLLNRSEIRP
jgi:hypothetical protein